VTALFDYPRSAAVGRVVPKSRIYEHAGAGTALRELFVAQVDQIVWSYKLAPETIRLAATTSVPEIQVLEIALRTGTLDEDVLRAIDRAIPFPLVFELTHAGSRRVAAAYKRPSDADAARRVISAYFASDWVPKAAPRKPLPVALDLGVLYERILTATMPVPAQPGEDIRSRVERMEAIRATTREIDRIRVRLRRERQFNKRVAINAELRAARMELERLARGARGPAAAND
jgi:hypothetical protein